MGTVVDYDPTRNDSEAGKLHKACGCALISESGYQLGVLTSPKGWWIGDLLVGSNS